MRPGLFWGPRRTGLSYAERTNSPQTIHHSSVTQLNLEFLFFISFHKGIFNSYLVVQPSIYIQSLVTFKMSLKRFPWSQVPCGASWFG